MLGRGTWVRGQQKVVLSWEVVVALCEPGWFLGGVSGNLRSELVVSLRRSVEKTPIWLPWALSVLSWSTHLEGVGETEEQGYHESFGL